MFLRKTLTIAILFFSALGYSQTYVSVNNGVDSSGCGGVNSPCATIQYAIDSTYNDTLILKQGKYRGQLNLKDSVSTYLVSEAFLNSLPNDVTLTTYINGVAQGTLLYQSSYTGFSSDPRINTIGLYGINIDSVGKKVPYITYGKDEGTVIHGQYDNLILESCSITNIFPQSYFSEFIPRAEDSMLISNTIIDVSLSSYWGVQSHYLSILNSKFENFFFIITGQNQNSPSTSDTITISGSYFHKILTIQAHVSHINNEYGEFIPRNSPLFWTFMEHCDINDLNPDNSYGSGQYKIVNSIIRDIPNLTAYYNEFKNNMIPSGTSISAAVNKSGNIFVNNINSLPSNNSNNPIFLGLGAGIPTGLSTDKDGNPRPMPAGTNPDIGPYESILSSPITCNLQVSVNYEDSICSNSNSWAFLQSTYPLDSVYWSNTTMNIDSALFTTGYHSVYLKDSLGCDTTVYFNIYSQQSIPSYDSYRPCYIFCDLDTGLNRVVMNTPTDVSGLYEWELLENVFGVWNVVSTKLVTDTTPWYHANSNPSAKSYQYKIRLKDSCGTSYTQSDTVNTILLQSSLGTNGEVNLSWNKYVGADIWYYVIYRKQGQAFYAIDSVGATNTSYIDNNAPTGSLTYYLGAVLQNPCSSSINKNGNLDNTRFFSNTVTQAVIGIDESSANKISIHPNPTSGLIQVQLEESFDYEVYDLTGKLLVKDYRKEQIDISKLPAGTYTVIITTKNRISNHIVQKL